MGLSCGQKRWANFSSMMTIGGPSMVSCSEKNRPFSVTAKSVVSLDPKTLAVKGTFSQAGAEFVTGPADSLQNFASGEAKFCNTLWICGRK